MDAQRFAGTLFKAGLLLITIPLGIYIISKVLLVSLCVRGLQSDDPRTVKQSLRRVQQYIFTEYMASRFEADEGVIAVATLLTDKMPHKYPGLMSEYLKTVQHLMQHPATREALIMATMPERLERAFSRGWIPSELQEEAHQLYLDLHAFRRMYMEEVYGPGAAPSPPAQIRPLT